MRFSGENSSLKMPLTINNRAERHFCCKYICNLDHQVDSIIVNTPIKICFRKHIGIADGQTTIVRTQGGVHSVFIESCVGG